MGAHGRAQSHVRFLHLTRVFRAAQGLVGFQRKLGINRQGAGRVGQMDQAIRPFAVRKRGLHRIGIGRQGLGHDVVQLNFTKSAARLFVGENVLQA